MSRPRSRVRVLSKQDDFVMRYVSPFQACDMVETFKAEWTDDTFTAVRLTDMQKTHDRVPIAQSISYREVLINAKVESTSQERLEEIKEKIAMFGSNHRGETARFAAAMRKQLEANGKKENDKTESSQAVQVHEGSLVESQATRSAVPSP